MLKDISPATFEKLSGLPQGFIQNVGDVSGFLQEEMGAPDLIGLRNSKRHDKFINDFVSCILPVSH